MIPCAATRDSPSWSGASGRNAGERRPAAAERESVVAAYGIGDTQGAPPRWRRRRSTTGSTTGGFILVEYFGFLRRDPEDESDVDMNGHDFRLQKMDSFTLAGEDVRLQRDAFERSKRAEVVKSFILADEYRRRFGR